MLKILLTEDAPEGYSTLTQSNLLGSIKNGLTRQYLVVQLKTQNETEVHPRATPVCILIIVNGRYVMESMETLWYEGMLRKLERNHLKERKRIVLGVKKLLSSAVQYTVRLRVLLLRHRKGKGPPSKMLILTLITVIRRMHRTPKLCRSNAMRRLTLCVAHAYEHWFVRCREWQVVIRNKTNKTAMRLS